MNIKQIAFMNIMISFIFSCVMGFAMLLINVGFIAGFVKLWLQSTMVGFSITLPISFLIIPPIQKLSLRLFNQ